MWGWPGCRLGKPLGFEAMTQIFRARGQEVGGLKNVTESPSDWAGYTGAVDKYLLKKRRAGLTKTPHIQLLELPVWLTVLNPINQAARVISPSGVNESSSCHSTQQEAESSYEN